ncbi:hypothetical protein ACOSQ4_007678 [Xanthoceras sorbifolium]
MVAVNTFISLEFIEADIQEASNVNILGIFHHRREGCSRHEEIDVGASSSQALQNQSNATLELNSPTLHLLSDENRDVYQLKSITEADETALHIATEQDKVLLSLLTPEDRADVFFRSIKNDLYGIALKFLKEHSGRVLAHDMDGDTALHVLARKSLYMSGFNKELIATYVDDEKNTLLHLAAKYPDQPSVGGLPAAAPNFQRELIIFKEVEKLMQPSLREAKNAQGLTPKELFAKESTQEVVTSGMVVATLIATVVFPAAITLPGAKDDKTGIPLYPKDPMLYTFAISNAIAMCSSSLSILSFLSIFTASYNLADFNTTLPRKLVTGFSALFTSVVAMMIAFIATYFLVFNYRSIFIPTLTIIIGAVTITLYVIQQYPLLKDLFDSIQIIYKKYFRTNDI